MDENDDERRYSTDEEESGDENEESNLSDESSEMNESAENSEEEEEEDSDESDSEDEESDSDESSELNESAENSEEEDEEEEEEKESISSPAAAQSSSASSSADKFLAGTDFEKKLAAAYEKRRAAGEAKFLSGKLKDAKLDEGAKSQQAQPLQQQPAAPDDTADTAPEQQAPKARSQPSHPIDAFGDELMLHLNTVRHKMMMRVLVARARRIGAANLGKVDFRIPRTVAGYELLVKLEHKRANAALAAANGASDVRARFGFAEDGAMHTAIMLVVGDDCKRALADFRKDCHPVFCFQVICKLPAAIKYIAGQFCAIAEPAGSEEDFDATEFVRAELGKLQQPKGRSKAADGAAAKPQQVPVMQLQQVRGAAETLAKDQEAAEEPTTIFMLPWHEVFSMAVKRVLAGRAERGERAANGDTDDASALRSGATWQAVLEKERKLGFNLLSAGKLDEGAEHIANSLAAATNGNIFLELYQKILPADHYRLISYNIPAATMRMAERLAPAFAERAEKADPEFDAVRDLKEHEQSWQDVMDEAMKNMKI